MKNSAAMKKASETYLKGILEYTEEELVSIDSALVRTAQEQSRVVTGSLGGRLAWPGLLRKIDRIDASYKT